jgi:hypothetical protein
MQPNVCSFGVNHLPAAHLIEAALAQGPTEVLVTPRSDVGNDGTRDAFREILRKLIRSC